MNVNFFIIFWTPGLRELVLVAMLLVVCVAHLVWRTGMPRVTG